MKSAKEWTHIINQSDAPCTSEGGGLWEDAGTYKIIKQIQLDAYKQGMTDAAEIANSLRKDLYGACSEAILSARDNKTEI